MCPGGAPEAAACQVRVTSGEVLDHDVLQASLHRVSGLHQRCACFQRAHQHDYPAEPPVRSTAKAGIAFPCKRRTPAGGPTWTWSMVLLCSAYSWSSTRSEICGHTCSRRGKSTVDVHGLPCPPGLRKVQEPKTAGVSACACQADRMKKCLDPAPPHSLRTKRHSACQTAARHCRTGGDRVQ